MRHHVILREDSGICEVTRSLTDELVSLKVGAGNLHRNLKLTTIPTSVNGVDVFEAGY